MRVTDGPAASREADDSREASADDLPARALLRLSPRAQALPTSATLAINEAVAQRRSAGRETVHLGFGEAPFPLHPALKSALAGAASRTSYAPVQGLPALREAIAGYLTRTRGVAYRAENIVVGPGSKPLLYALFQVLDGDLLLPVPSWVSYAPMARLAGKRVIATPTTPDDRLRLTPDALSAALIRARRDGADPRLLLVNSPSNPTGGMFDLADVEAIADWARDAGVTLISDEIYAELAHGWRAHISPARCYPEASIVTGGLSKAFSAGGWRLGYAALPATSAGEAAMAALRALASEVWSAAATPLQEAALAAFLPDAEIEDYVRRSARVHAYVTGRLHDALTRLGVPCPRPAGGFYLYPDFSPWRAALQRRGVTTSTELARHLLDVFDIATLPGSAFNEAPDALRLRLATSLLCEPDSPPSPRERDAALWRLLERADSLEAPGAPAPALPALERAEARWVAVIQEWER
jgi:aspartate/methionine/tyrosine aminotransferase